MPRIFTSKDIDEIVDNYRKGLKQTRKNQIFYQNQEGTLNDNINIVKSHEELLEYSKCANNICYFIESYCGLKLRDYQVEWIKHFENNRFAIYDTSRQTGYSQVMTAVYLHYMIFNTDKNIVLFANKNDTSCDFIQKIFNYYLILPYWLKPGIVVKNLKNIHFNTGCRIYSSTRSKTAAIGITVDILSYLEFSHIPQHLLDYQFTGLIHAIIAHTNTRIIIQSQPNGFNKFYELINNSERKPGDPLKNAYKTIKTYWWEVSGRDDAWKHEHIKMLGSEELFNQEYDLQFHTKNNNIK